jgi:acetyl esterase
MERYGSGHFLTKESMAFFRESYTQNDPQVQGGFMASPLHARNLVGLPPTTIVTASHDPLVDEGRAFYQRLLGEGVGGNGNNGSHPVKYVEYAGEVHVFWLFGKVIKGAERCIADLANELKGAFPKFFARPRL